MARASIIQRLRKARSMGELDQPPRLLDDIRSNDPARVNAALERLTDELVAYARSISGRHGNKVNSQAGSIVQSVLMRELGDGVGCFENEAQLRGRLHVAIKHKAIERLRGPKGETGQMSQYAEAGLPDPSAKGPGVGTQIAEIDREQSLVPLLTRGLSDLDREIVLRSVLADEDSQTVGKALGISADVVRQRLHNLRPDLRARLLEPLRKSVTSEEWMVLSACLIKRMSPQAAADLLGIKAWDLANVLERALFTHVRDALGKAGIAALERLLGRIKT